MAIKTIRVFAEYTSDGYVPMPSQGNIDYGITLGSTFPETEPNSYQLDDPNIDVAVTTMTDYYVWIRTHGSSWNPSYTRVVRIYPDSPSINSVVMNMIVAVGSGGTSISASGGVSYYLNGGTSQGVLDGSTYYEMNKVPVEGTGVDFFKINTTGFENIAQFVTDAGDPGLLKIPAGNWPLGFYFSASDNSGNPKFYATIYKYSAAGVFTQLGTSSATPEVISNGMAIDYYTTTVAIPETTLLVTDRIAIRIFVNTDGNRTVNFHTQDSHLAQVGTTFPSGLTAINGLTKQVQYIAIGNAGSDAAIVSSDDTHTLNLPTASATKRGLLNSTDWSTFNAKQAALSGDGFVKISGSTISYDNNTYLTPLDAASVYQRLDKMVSNLLPSNTEYPNSNAVLAKLALKANIENPSFTGSMNIVGIESRINFYDENNAIKYFIGYDSGFLRIFQNAGSASRFYINSDGKTFIPGILEVGSVIKSGGTASQFLKADGSVDGATYATSSSLSSYLLSSVAATTYQRIDKMVSNLLASDTEYPNSNAVLAKLALKADAANPNFTGSMNITGIESRINFYDENNARKYFIGYDGGTLRIYQDAGSASRYYINPSGKTFIPGDLEVGTVSKSGGTASQFLKADGSVDSSTYVTSASLSSYLLSSTAASTYQRLDKMVSNLLASSTEYPNSNAVLAALALKANAANPTFTGDFTISGATPRLYFVDTDNNPDYTLFTDSGYFYIYDQTAGATRFSINSSGNINSGVGKSITAGSFVKESGTSSQFLMADGSISTGPAGGITGSLTANYIPLATGTNTLGNSIIYSNGTSVGIGATTLFRKLEVITGNGITDGIRLTYANGSTTEGMDITYLNTGTTTTSFDSLYNSAAAVMQFRMKTAATPVIPLTLFGSGNVMIGTTVDQGFKFAVNGTSRFYDSIQFAAGDRALECSGSAGVSFYSNEINSGSQGIAGDLYLGYRRTNRTYIMSALTVNSAATFNSSISMTNPIGITGDLQAIKLRAGSTTGYSYLRFYNSGDASRFYMGLFNSGGVDYGLIDGSGYRFEIAGTPIVLNNNGYNVLVGTTTDSGYKFDVNGTGRFTGQLTSDYRLGLPGMTIGYWDSANNRIESGSRPLLITSYSQPIYIGQSGSANLTIATSGAATFSSSVTATQGFFSNTSGNQVVAYYGASDYLNIQHNGLTTKNNQMNLGTNLNSTPTLALVGNNVLVGTTLDAGYKLYVSGQTIAVNNGTTAEIRLQGGGYGANYNTSLRSISGATGVLQFGNNGDNVVLIGNTAAGGRLDFRTNVNAESIVAGSLCLRLNADATATFYSNLNASAFFESSDFRLKTLIEHNPIVAGIENLQAKLYEKNGKIELGYFAQDAEKIMPYAVTKNEDGFLNLSYREVHTAKIARLEQRVAELERQLNVA